MGRLPDLTTRLSRQQCAERINEATGSGWNLFSRREVIGKVGRGGGSLIRNRSILVRNSFRPVLRLRFKAIEGGTLVRCRIGLEYFVLFFSLFFAILMLAALRYLTLPYVLALLAGRPPGEDPMLPWMPVIMLGFFSTIWLLGRMTGGGDEAILLNFVRKKLEAGGDRLNLTDI